MLLQSNAEFDVIDSSERRNSAVCACCRELSDLLGPAVTCNENALDICLAVLARFNVSACERDQILEISCLGLLADGNEQTVNVDSLLAAVFPARKL